MPVLRSCPVNHVGNPRALPSVYGPMQARLLNADALAAAKREMSSWPGYAATPLYELAGLAAAIRVGRLSYKDEGPRFGLGSFKALGGPYALYRLLTARIAAEAGAQDVSSQSIIDGAHRDIVAGITVACATDGNHGRAVAWGAGMFGCRCVIYLHEHVSQGREDAIAGYGAEIVRTPGHYDDSVRAVKADCTANGWHLLSDTAGEDYGSIQTDIMQGYGMITDEALEQMAGAVPTHVIGQGGVGGLPAGVFAPIWERYGDRRPRFVVVEPQTADCLLRSAAAGRPETVPGDLDTVMACLAAGEVNYPAWEILDKCTDDFIAIPDAAAEHAMRVLADAPEGDPPIVAGESGAAGMAGLLAAAADPKLCEALALGPDSHVLVIGSEGATDPAIYERIVGRPPEAVTA